MPSAVLHCRTATLLCSGKVQQQPCLSLQLHQNLMIVAVARLLHLATQQRCLQNMHRSPRRGAVLHCSSAAVEPTTHRCSCNDEQGCCHLATDCSSAAGYAQVSGKVLCNFCSSAGLYELQNHRCSCSDKQGCCHLATDSSGERACTVAVLQPCRNCRSAAQQPAL